MIFKDYLCILIILFSSKYIFIFEQISDQNPCTIDVGSHPDTHLMVKAFSSQLVKAVLAFL